MLKKFSPLGLLGMAVCLGVFAAAGWSMFRAAVDALELRRQQENPPSLTEYPAEDQAEWPDSTGDISIRPAQYAFYAGGERFSLELINGTGDVYYFAYDLQYRQDGMWYYVPHRPGVETPAAQFTLPAGEAVAITIAQGDYVELLPGTYRAVVYLEAAGGEHPAAPHSHPWYDLALSCEFQAEQPE